MPGGLDETCEILRFLARDVFADTFVNVMSQYRPKGLVGQYPAINRSLAPREFQEARAAAREVSLRLAQRQ